MKTWLHKMFSKQSHHRQAKAPLRTRLQLECLEDRRLMSFTPPAPGAVLLPHVEVQALYYGSGWNTGLTTTLGMPRGQTQTQTSYLNGFLNNITHSSYMNMLTNAGYGVGYGGRSWPGYIDTIPSWSVVTDSMLRSELQTDILLPSRLQQPDANRLYVIFVQPNVEVNATSVPGVGGTSVSTFLGYHSAFQGLGWQGSTLAVCDIHYAVIAYPGGSVGNLSLPWLLQLQGMTEVASHELAEAVTDPNGLYKAWGWIDFSRGGEVGDVVNGSTVFLNGYAVQRISDTQDQAMTPAGATAAIAESFALMTNGDLWFYNSSSNVKVLTGVASISDQAIDNYGQVMVDGMFSSGTPFEYHEGSPTIASWNAWVNVGLFPTWLSGLGFTPVAAKADQGGSYIQFTDTSTHTRRGLYYYNDASPNQVNMIAGDYVSQFDAGTDKYGVNMVDLIYNIFNSPNALYEYSNTSGWSSPLARAVLSVSAGQQGLTLFVDSAHNAWMYNDATYWSPPTEFDSNGNVRQVATGTGGDIYVVDTNNNMWWYGVTNPFTFLGSPPPTLNFIMGNVSSTSKDRAGLLTIVETDYNAYNLQKEYTMTAYAPFFYSLTHSLSKPIPATNGDVLTVA
jgi:hypothetical protein